MALAQHCRGLGIAGRRRTDPERHDVELAVGHVQVAPNVGARGLRIADHAVGAMRRGRDQHAHAEAEHAEVRVRHDAVEQVVDRHDAAKAPACRRSARKAVQDIDAGAPREPGQQLLLAAHPLHAAAGEDRHLDDLGELVPLAARRTRLTVDERRDSQVGTLGRQRAQQLAGIDLHAALLARNEEYEVQANVHVEESRKPPAHHRRRGPTSARQSPGRDAALAEGSRRCGIVPPRNTRDGGST